MKTLVASTPLPFFPLSHFLYHHLVLVSDFLSILCAHKNMCGFFQKNEKRNFHFRRLVFTQIIFYFVSLSSLCLHDRSLTSDRSVTLTALHVYAA